MTYINLPLRTQEYAVDKLSDKSVARRASWKDMMMISMVKKVLLLVALFAFVSVAQAANFAGPRKCGNCHKEEYADWKESPHAFAYSDEIFQQSWGEMGSGRPRKGLGKGPGGREHEGWVATYWDWEDNWELGYTHKKQHVFTKNSTMRTKENDFSRRNIQPYIYNNL